MRELNLHDLLGRVVHDVNGERVGRIEELHAVDRGEYLEVTSFALGVVGWLSRMFSTPVVGHSASALGLNPPKPKIVPWDALDLSDPSRPRLTKSRRDIA